MNPQEHTTIRRTKLHYMAEHVVKQSTHAEIAWYEHCKASGFYLTPQFDVQYKEQRLVLERFDMPLWTDWVNTKFQWAHHDLEQMLGIAKQLHSKCTAGYPIDANMQAIYQYVHNANWHSIGRRIAGDLSYGELVFGHFDLHALNALTIDNMYSPGERDVVLIDPRGGFGNSLLGPKQFEWGKMLYGILFWPAIYEETNWHGNLPSIASKLASIPKELLSWSAIKWCIICLLNAPKMYKHRPDKHAWMLATHAKLAEQLYDGVHPCELSLPSQ